MKYLKDFLAVLGVVTLVILVVFGLWVCGWLGLFDIVYMSIICFIMAFVIGVSVFFTWCILRVGGLIHRLFKG